MIKKLLFASHVLIRWLPSHLNSIAKGRRQPVHVLFCMVDHYEPGTGNANPELERERMHRLLVDYPRLADAHRDSCGNIPRRSWFFPPHYHRNGNLRDLVSLCEKGYGEIELHLHHGKACPDTSENLRKTLELCVRDYSLFGVFGTTNGRKQYGFIHGDWALNNSRAEGRYCGVKDELKVLQETGCYADFTFPSYNESNPAKINTLFYAKAARCTSSSHKRGIVSEVGKPDTDGLLMIQGPLHPIWMPDRRFGLRVCGDDIALDKPPSERRVDAWIKTGIHVVGKREWIIVKVHTHGAIDAPVATGRPMDECFTYLEQRYGCGQSSVLHYVTARELYNIVKAAEAGECGNPEEYRDYIVERPQYDATPSEHGASEELHECVRKTYTE